MMYIERVRDGIAGYRFVFQRFLYVRTICVRFFLPEYLRMFFI